jgi:hypothetical protein
MNVMMTLTKEEEINDDDDIDSEENIDSEDKIYTEYKNDSYRKKLTISILF